MSRVPFYEFDVGSATLLQRNPLTAAQPALEQSVGSPVLGPRGQLLTLPYQPGTGEAKEMPIREWPSTERPREKLLERGPAALSDAELLAAIIGCGTKGRSAVDVGRAILQEFGSIRQFLIGERKKCLQLLGIGPARWVIMQAALELARRHQLDRLREGPALAAPDTARAFLQSKLRDLPYEVFCCLHLDTRHRLLAFEELFRGTIDGASVHAREVARQVMRHNSAAVIFAHNHPSGVPEPSRADEHVTRMLCQALGLLEVRVLDHIVVGDRSCVSFAERGLL